MHITSDNFLEVLENLSESEYEILLQNMRFTCRYGLGTEEQRELFCKYLGYTFEEENDPSCTATL